jgi:maleamate amidohydrolase
VTARVWDRFLTEQDRAHIAIQPAIRKGVGTRPALLMVDLYRWVFGDEPEPLLESIETWPGSCGLIGWEALPHIERLLAQARALGIPVIHIVNGVPGMAGWRDVARTTETVSPEVADRARRRYDILDEVAPLPNEPVFHKSAPSAFWGTPIVGLLHGMGIDTLVVAGESTSGCVRATVVDAKSYRFKVVVPEECVFDRHEAAHAINLFDMDQKYADVVPLDEAIGYFEEIAAARTGG